MIPESRFEILPRKFYARPTVEVARDLLGKVVVHGSTAGMIVETEAYLGDGDLAAHSSRGLTGRTRVLFGPPGHAYIYFIYGMYDCLNVVTERDGVAGGVLIRALEPLTDIATMQRRRPAAKTIEQLASGPGKLTLALDITRKLNGADLTAGTLTLRRPSSSHRFSIEVTRRIGISQCVDLPLRFVIRGNRFVSGR